MFRSVLAIVCAAVVFVAAGCATTKTVTIRTDPPDALIRIPDAAPVLGMVRQQFTFDTPTRTYLISATRVGFRDATEWIKLDDPRTEITLKLKPETRSVDFIVKPVPAVISIDGKPITTDPVNGVTQEIEMGVDPKTNIPIVHEVTATHENFQPATLKISRADTSRTYTLTLEPMSKPISVSTDPPGAQIYLDDSLLGTSPLKDVPVDFPVNFADNQFIPRTLKAVKAGYADKEISINWDNGKRDYAIDFAANTKQVRITTDPPGAKVFVDGNEIPTGAGGRAVTALQFPPINSEGQLKTYVATVSKKSDDAEWETKTIQIGWDAGREDYTVALNEIRTRPVQLLLTNIRHGQSGWEIIPDWVSTQAMRDTAEPAGRPTPQAIHKLAKGYQLGSVTLSPDGSTLLFTTLSTAADGKSDFHSQICSVRADGSEERKLITDGKSLDVMPSFTPAGDQIVFSSNRGGRRLNVWRVPATGGVEPTRLTSSESNDLWPMIDSDPRPRLFYQSMIDSRSDPRIFMMQLASASPTDLVYGSQPRVGPKNDSIVYWVKSESSDNRDIFRITDRGGAPENLTNTPDADEYDANWSRDGTRIVFASNRGVDDTGRHNYDIWMIDLAKPQQPIQLTANGSHDDSPVFDVMGENVYFRSNRGGEWGIWKISLPK
jgi:TolB protein